MDWFGNGSVLKILALMEKLRPIFSCSYISSRVDHSCENPNISKNCNKLHSALQHHTQVAREAKALQWKTTCMGEVMMCNGGWSGGLVCPHNNT